jgi:hypothetical protein
MDEQNYTNERVEDQINWYDKRSGDYQRLFKRLRIGQIIGASIIPFLTGFADGNLYIQIAVGALGVLVAVLSAIDGLLKPQQLWLEYRTTAETLKHQKFLYQTGTAPYHEDNAFNVFVENFENIISKENSRWAQQMSKQKPKEQPTPKPHAE